MFEKYKEKEKEYRYWGMSKGDLVRLVFMIGAFIFVIAMIVVVLPRIVPPPPGKSGEIVRVQPPRTAGEPGAKAWFEKIKREKLRQLQAKQKEPPKPKEPFKPNAKLLNEIRDDDYVADLEGVTYLLHKLNWERRPLEEGGDVSAALREPARWRGKVVSVAGRLLSLEKKRLRENPSGLTEVWVANVRTKAGRVTCYFYEKESVFASAEEFPEYQGDEVRIKGLFLQRLREGRGVVVGRRLMREGYGPGRPSEPQKPCEELDRKVLERIEDGAPSVDQQALLHTVWWLNSQLRAEFEKWFLPNCWRIDKALQNYQEARFAPVWVDGSLTRIRLLHLPRNASGVEWVFEGTLLTEVIEEPVRVLFFEEEREIKLHRGAEEGDLVRVRGILLGRLRTETREGEVVRAPVVAARGLEFVGEKGGSTPPLVPFQENAKLWEEAPVKAAEPWERGVEYALHYINSMPYEEFARLARKKAIWIGQAFDAPQRNFGKLVWVEGNLNTCAEGPNTNSLSGVNRYLFGQIYCFQTRNNYIWFVCWEKERDFNTYRAADMPGDPVRLYGIFVCTWVAKYPSGARFEIPVVVGRRLLAAPQPEMFAEFPWVTMLIVGGAIFVMTVFFVLRSRQEIKATSEVLRKVRAKMAAAAGSRAKSDQSAAQPQKDEQRQKEPSNSEGGEGEGCGLKDGQQETDDTHKRSKDD